MDQRLCLECGYPLQVESVAAPPAEVPIGLLHRPGERHGDERPQETVVLPAQVAPYQQSLRCPACGHANPDSRRRCQICGSPLVQIAYERRPAPLPDPPPERRRTPWGLIALVLGVVAAVVIAYAVVSRGGPETDTVVETPPPSQPAGVSEIVPVGATASSTAPDSTDDAGTSVTFSPRMAIDGVPDTAWRAAEGDGVGESLTLDLGGTFTVTSVGLVPGYDKVDPKTQVSRFLENRRVERVRWVFDDGQAVEQEFSDAATMQSIPVSARTSTIRIEIEMTRPPQVTPGREFTPISAVRVEGFPG